MAAAQTSRAQTSKGYGNRGVAYNDDVLVETFALSREIGPLVRHIFFHVLSPQSQLKRAKSTQKPLHGGQSQLAFAFLGSSQLNQREQPTSLKGMPAMPAMHLRRAQPCRRRRTHETALPAANVCLDTLLPGPH
eukprot:scaffold5865_cov71-Phaeocystis_antarctica.AAC.2